MHSPTADPWPARTGVVTVPQGEEEWNEFLARYTQGEFVSFNFTDRQASPQDTTGDDGRRGSLVESTLESSTLKPDPASLSRRASVPRSSSATRSLRHQPLQTSDSESKESDSSGPPGLSDSHPDVSASGPSNQDPSIPNIPDSNEAQPAVRAAPFLSPPLPDEQGGPSDMALSKANMDQLAQAQQRQEGDIARKAEADGEAQPRRRRAARKDRAALASVGRAVSANSSSDDGAGTSTRRKTTGRPRPPYSTRNRYSRTSIPSVVAHPLPVDQILLESGSNTTSSADHFEMPYDYAAERKRLRDFYEKNGFMPAPRQAPDASHRRLRVIRRLGIETPEEIHRVTLDRFTRLAVSIFKTKMALISIVGQDRQIFLSEIGFGVSSTELEISFCCHAIMGSGEQCLIVPNADEDWRFRHNPVVTDTKNPAKFYAGAPLKVGTGNKAAIIGSLCILDDHPREFDEHSTRLLQDLADCVVSELELLYNQQASVESAKLHQISVDFLRRSLKTRPNENAGASRPSGTSASSSSGKKRKEGADQHVSDLDVDMYDEACSEIRLALDAYAVAVVDLSQFHLFYPAYQNSSTAGSSTTLNTGSKQDTGPSTSRTASTRPGQSFPRNTSSGSSVSGNPQARAYSSTSAGFRAGSEESEAYAKPMNCKLARQTYAMTDPTAPSRTPQVLFIPARRKTDAKTAKLMGLPEAQGDSDDQLAVLGYSCAEDGFAFNFTSSLAARKIISDFIAANVKTRRVWYTRDDSAGIAQSITQLMPHGTETSMAMPVFGFDGQVAFAVVACWTDPLYTYPAGAMQFVETIAGSLLASVMKERLHQAERAQLSFAAAASHELRTPLHQINAAATLLRACLHPALSSPVVTPPLSTENTGTSPESPRSPRIVTNPSSKTLSPEDRTEAISHLEIIESNGLALGNILENIIDTLDIGRMASRIDEATAVLDGQVRSQETSRTDERYTDFAQVLEQVIQEATETEKTMRSISGVGVSSNVEMILEILPRHRGGWLMMNDPGPIIRQVSASTESLALGKIIQNSCKFTNKGFIHITVQDVSRDVVLPAGYDNSIRLSTISIDIKDSGCGMTGEFLEREVLRPFAKANPFMPGSGLGLGLAQRMIEILGGKLAIASTLNKGTLVHVELPVHLLNDDNISDQDELQQQGPGTSISASGSQYEIEGSRNAVRQDGIYLAGFDGMDAGVRRVGKSLHRQLKLNSCRVVSDLHYANLIVVADGSLHPSQIAALAQGARPTVQVIILTKDDVPLRSPHPALANVPITYLSRPLRPSVMAAIMKPPELSAPPQETYVSAVVGGSEAGGPVVSPSEIGGPISSPEALDSASSMAGSAASTIIARPPAGPRELSTGSMTSSSAISAATSLSPRRTDTSEDLMPSPPHTPDDLHGPFFERSPFTVLVGQRPGLGHEHASDPFPLVNWSDSDSSHESSQEISRPTLREAVSGPMVEGQGPADGPMRVLVVEDNSVNRRILTTMLKRTACHFAEAVDGQDAIRQFRVFRPNIVLLDINMPVKDGFVAAAEMRHIESTHKWQRSRIIAVTALSGEAQRRRGMIECGIDEWRTKPVGIKSLKEDVERWKAEHPTE